MAGIGAPDDSSPAVGPSQDARRRELEALVYGGDGPSAADVAELRALLAVPRSDPSSADGPLPRHRSDGASSREFMSSAVDSDRRDDPRRADPRSLDPHSHEHRSHERPARAWLAGGVVAIVLAGLIGAGATTSILGSRSGSGPVGATASTTGPPEGTAAVAAPAAIGASSAAAGLGGAAEAEALGAQYFDQAQSTGDRPPVDLPGIVTASTRRVFADWGQEPGEASVWVARGRDQSFCLIVSVDATHAGSSCTPVGEAATAGVRVSVLTARGGSIEVSWNLEAGLLELSPFPAGASVISSGAFPPTP